MCIWYLCGSLLTVPWLLKVYVISLYILIDILFIPCKTFACKTSKICILYIRMFIHCTLADGKGGNCPISSLRLNRNENASALFFIHSPEYPRLGATDGQGNLVPPCRLDISFLHCCAVFSLISFWLENTEISSLNPRSLGSTYSRHSQIWPFYLFLDKLGGRLFQTFSCSRLRCLWGSVGQSGSLGSHRCHK